MSMNRHDHFEELISASLSGDLTDSERQELDAHLDSCDACRATLASFADQRRIMAGLRHVAPPRDLGARVRSGIETGARGETPWWRRPAFAFAGLGGGLAAVAGALLAIVLLNGSPDDPQVGGGSESPAASVSFSPAASAATPTAAPVATPTSAEPSPSPEAATPSPEVAPEPDVYLAYTGPFDNLLLTLRDGRTGVTLRELEPHGPVVAAQLSPNGQFLAYISRLGESGMNEVWVTRIGSDVSLSDAADVARIETPLAEWETISLGQSVAGSEFLEHLSWSPGGHYVAYTLAATNGGGTDAWFFDVTVGESQQLTSFGDAYAGSWMPGSIGTALWLSRAGDQPMSYGLEFDSSGGGPSTPGDDVNGGTVAVNVFQPLLSPDGSQVIYWRGGMQRSGDEWAFVQGGSPYLADAPLFDNPWDFANERPLFSDLTIDQDAFTSAGIAWGADSDAYAVWDAEWTGLPQGSRGEYPSSNRVYFGHASDPRNLTEVHAIDEGDIPEDASVVDVKVPTGRHLLITAQEPIGGSMESPKASLILVTRNTGGVPDEVLVFSGPGDDGWFGPGGYDGHWGATAP